MSSVRVLSLHTHLAELVVDHFQTLGHVAEVREADASQLVLRVRPALSVDDRASLLAALRPYAPRVEEVASLDVDAELHLGAPGGLSGVEVRIATDCPDACEALSESLGAIGLPSARCETTLVSESVMRFGGASRFVRQTLRWLLARQGIERVQEQKVWETSDSDVWVYAPHPKLAALPPRQRFEVLVRTDDSAAAKPMLARLEGAGFRVNVAPLELPFDGRATKFTFDPGPFARVGSPEDHKILLEAVRTLLVDRCVHPDRWPLAEAAPPVRSARARVRPPGFETGGSSLVATIDLPLGALARGELRPYDGRGADRYEVIVRAETEAHGQEVIAALRELGFVWMRFERHKDPAAQPRVTCGSLREDTALRERVLEVARACLGRLAGVETPKVESRVSSGDDERVVVDVPISGVADGTRAARALRGLGQYRVVVHHEGGDMSPLLQSLQTAGFRRPRLESAGACEGTLQFGGAPDVVVEKVAAICRETLGLVLDFENRWSPADRDLFVWVPGEAIATSAHSAEQGEPEVSVDFAGWVHGRGGAASRPFVESLRDAVHFGPCTLPKRSGRRHPLAPRPSDFDHFTIDAKTAETLLHVGQAIAMREPCLLEGDTSTAKTSSVLYVASLLGQPVSRVNLHGQTDTGELVGRYVPNDGDGAASWRWHDGVLLRAMREGHWLLLDEVNLAEPQILERFNSLLEREPTLVVTEHEGERLCASDVHPDFRLLATANPAEYAGRSALSPAWRDRWRAHRILPAPGEREIEHFLRVSVFGSAAAIEAAGVVWPTPTTTPAWGALASAPGMASFLSALARFHVSLERAFASADAPGRARRERYVVTRRNLLSVLDWLRAHGGTVQAMRGALVRYYLERVAPQDRAAVVRLLDAVGLGPTTWTVDVAARTEAA